MINTIIQVTIEKLVLGGYGLAHHNGQVVFVPFSAPGDTLDVKVTSQKKKTLFGEIQKIVTPSALRNPAPCKVFGSCGGCHWQHISYQEQLQWKNRLVLEALKSVVTERTQIHPIISSPKEWNYRNRIRLKWDGKSLGFFKRKSHDFVEAKECLIADNRINQKFQDASIKLKGKPPQELTLSVDGASDISQFSQVNSLVNEALKEVVLEWAQKPSSSVIYDLYAGSGNFSFPLQSRFKGSLVGVELSLQSVQLARENIKNLSLRPDQCEFYLSSVDLFLKKNPLLPSSLVIVDPPREGLSNFVVQSLLDSNVSQVLYISCDPATLARDLKLLSAKFKIKQLQVFDMFPQTAHIETLVDLQIDG